jgi:hypothetical protein
MGTGLKNLRRTVEQSLSEVPGAVSFVPSLTDPEFRSDDEYEADFAEDSDDDSEDEGL